MNSPEIKDRIREVLVKMELVMKENDYATMGDSDSAPVTSTFSNGVYTREIFIPKGTWIMGKIHRHEHMNFLVKGSVVMMTEDSVGRVEAYKSMLSPAGTKRFLFTLEDTIWITVHRTDATNAVDAEREIIANTYNELGDKS